MLEKFIVHVKVEIGDKLVWGGVDFVAARGRCFIYAILVTIGSEQKSKVKGDLI